MVARICGGEGEVEGCGMGLVGVQRCDGYGWCMVGWVRLGCAEARSAVARIYEAVKSS